MQELKTLIDKASKVCGSDAALAKRLGIAPQTVSNLRSTRTITPETAAELADIAGEDAREAAILAILERAKGTRREGVLREVLGKALAAGVAGMLVFSYSDGLSSAMENQTKSSSLSTVYTSWNMRRRRFYEELRIFFGLKKPLNKPISAHKGDATIRRQSLNPSH